MDIISDCNWRGGLPIIQATKSKGLDSPFRETPMEILKKRYAKGKITKEEFEKMKKDLES